MKSSAAAERVLRLCRANPVWLDPFCRNLELAAQADHEDDLPENLSEITDLWNSPARTHGTFGREPQARPEDDRYLRAAIQEYDNIAKLGQIMREGPIKVRLTVSTRAELQELHSLLAVGGRRPCVIQSPVPSGFSAQGGPRRLPEAEKALCSATRHRFHRAGRRVVRH